MYTYKKLRRMQIEPVILQKLERQKLETSKDVLLLSRNELLNLLSSDKKRKQLIKTVSMSCCPSSCTAYQMYIEKHRTADHGFLRTFITKFDEVLCGGLPFRSITEITGPPSVGKTQFCLLLSVAVALPQSVGGLESAVIYIDTESAFCAKRLKEIAETRFPDIYKSQDQLLNLLKSIYVHHVMSLKQLKEVTEKIECDIIRRNVKLIVIDSMASLPRKEFGGADLASVVQRNKRLLELAAALKSIAERCRIAIFLTNQITTHVDNTKPVSVGAEDELEDYRVDSDAKPYLGKSSRVIPALGLTWSHCINTRLVAQFSSPVCRQLLIVKSPVARNAATYYRIEKSGIVLTDDEVDELEFVDPNCHSIQAKSIFGEQKVIETFQSSL